MALDPLSLIILLFFLAVVALALTLWFLLTLRQPASEPEPARAKVSQPAQKAADLDLETTNLNNDDFRGAKAQAKPTEPTPEPPISERPVPERPPKRDDAFERFIKSKNDELEF